MPTTTAVGSSPERKASGSTPRSSAAPSESLGARCGIQNLTIRSLRHFHATVMLQSGQNPVVVSKRLGHANVSITSQTSTPTPYQAGSERPQTAFAEAMMT